MRNLRVLALLAGLGWCCRAQAAVDCNMPEFEFVNDAYVCLSGTFKAQNNQIQDMEDKLKRPSEKIRNELAQVKKKLARETGDTPKASAARKRLEKWADELRRRVDEADRDAREKRNFIGQIKNEGRECRTEKCMKEVYAKTLAGLIGFSRQPACTLPQIADECEVYVYNTPPQAKKSMAPLLSEKLYTYREKVRINRPDKCVYLFLASGYPQVWDILTTEGTDLRGIYVGGDLPQLVRGYPEGTEVRVHYRGELLKGAENCLRSSVDLDKRQENNFLDRLKIAPERRIYVSDGKILCRSVFGQTQAATLALNAADFAYMRISASAGAMYFIRDKKLFRTIINFSNGEATASQETAVDASFSDKATRVRVPTDENGDSVLVVQGQSGLYVNGARLRLSGLTDAVFEDGVLKLLLEENGLASVAYVDGASLRLTEKQKVCFCDAACFAGGSSLFVVRDKAVGTENF